MTPTDVLSCDDLGFNAHRNGDQALLRGGIRGAIGSIRPLLSGVVGGVLLYIRASSLTRVPGVERVVTRALDSGLDRAYLLLRAVTYRGVDSSSDTKKPRAWISPMVAHAAEIAVRILPSVNRSRYAEEYAAELSELENASRRAQWAYAVRLVVCAPRLRRELRREVRSAVQER